MNRLRPSMWWAASAVVLLVGVGSVGLGLRGHQVALAGPDAPALVPASGAGAPAGLASTASPVARAAPAALRIPAIKLSVPVIGLGLNPDGTVEVPRNFSQAGWFRLGPSPGQSGSAVILGHVDSYRGPAVFFRLRSLRVGDEVDVSLSDGVLVRFAVTWVAIYPKDEFPAEVVYGTHGYSGLQLVTCGGTFDTGARSYLSNVVVYTRRVLD